MVDLITDLLDAEYRSYDCSWQDWKYLPISVDTIDYFLEIEGSGMIGRSTIRARIENWETGETNTCTFEYKYE